MPTYRNANEALPDLLRRVLNSGATVPSRNGTTKELLMQQVTLTHPTPAEITVPGRRVSLPAQIAETMWLLAGRNDIGWLSHYLPRAAEFSDDGATWRGGYGPRLRAWDEGGSDQREFVDQLAHVVQLLKDDAGTRRAVLSIYSPNIDTQPGKDIPCNNWVHFIPRDGVLHAHVAIRSNDLMWGWSGINSFEWTSLLTIVAGLTELAPGSITFSISSLHLYEHHWAKAQSILDQQRGQWSPTYANANPEFHMPGGATMEDFDLLVNDWFTVEEQIRKGNGFIRNAIDGFPEPLLRSWLWVLFAWHHGSDVPEELRNTSLDYALRSSPAYKPALARGGAVQAPKVNRPAFTVFATKLHAEKNAAYGDSWKKRGEMLGIMANIARKVDRLGVAGGGDTAADTAIDLMMYLIKYDLWLRQQSGAQDAPTSGQSHVFAVDAHLQFLETHAPHFDPVGSDDLIRDIRIKFDKLEHWVEEKRATRGELVRSMIQLAYPLAVRLWGQEELAAKWQAGNATRTFSYEQGEQGTL